MLTFLEISANFEKIGDDTCHCVSGLCLAN